jgi:hypothetical protein
MSGISQILIVLQIMTISSSQNSSELKIVALQVVVWFGLVLWSTLNNISAISWRSVLLVEETGVPGENHRSLTNFIT